MRVGDVGVFHDCDDKACTDQNNRRANRIKSGNTLHNRVQRTHVQEILVQRNKSLQATIGGAQSRKGMITDIRNAALRRS